jgi:alpha-amylase/alpha-mannosidase (GH57 family)
LGHNDHIDLELSDSINELVDSGEIQKGTPAFGVAQQVIHSGYDSLSQNQKSVYDNHVVPALRRLAEENEANRVRNSNPD